jgi:hypothetical protein
MSRQEHDVRRAVALRDLAERRVRRITVAAIAGATALTGAFAGLAAASTHLGKHGVRHDSPRSVTAPTPTLVPNGVGSEAEPSEQQQQQQVQPPAAAPPSLPPVVSSGGS